MEAKKTGGFGSAIGFVLSAAGSAVGVGNIWRFPYLAAQDGGGLFLLVYLILVLTFGFTLLTTDIVIGRKTGKSALTAFSLVHHKWGFIGKLAFIIPALIITYYTVIGGWITKYMVVYVSGQHKMAAADGYFSSFMESHVSPIIFMLIFLAITSFVVFTGVEKGIEKFSKFIMPVLIILILGISIFSLTLKHTTADGTVRTGLQGLAVYAIPNFEGLTFSKFMKVLMDAMNQLFFSLSVAMGIMVTYGSYVKKDINLNKSITQIEIFDTAVAFLAGMMIIPAVYVFSGTEGMASGPSLMFVSLPKVFDAMGTVGPIIGFAFFVMVFFAALTSCVSLMETIVAGIMERFHVSRKKASLSISIFTLVIAVIVCLGYNIFYFNITLPNGVKAQILDVVDYISNGLLMPIVCLSTCILIGWVVKPQWIVDEMEHGGHKFHRKKLYIIMIRYIAPIIMGILFLQSIGLI